MADPSGSSLPLKHSYGWVPDVPDQRDFLFSALPPLRRKLPLKVDLRDHCSTVEDQGALGSCTAQALVGALEFLERKNDTPFKDLSRLFVYYNERVIEHSVESDSGASLRNGIKTLVKQGVCAENGWPYDVTKFTVRPSDECYTEALDHQVTSYRRIVTLNEMLSCLASGFPFVFGFAVYESFEAPDVAKTGVVSLPCPGERMLGGHAVLAVGYDRDAETFLVRNSWGKKWGKKGYFTMPFAYLDNKSLSDDFWTVRKGENI